MGCGISCADGILKLDDIDMDSADKDLSDDILRFSQSADVPEIEEEPEDIHHTSCFLEQCASHAHAAVARKFVWSMNRMLQSGSLALRLKRKNNEIMKSYDMSCPVIIDT